MLNWWHEDTLQNALLSFLCRDRNFLKQFSTLLSSKDFVQNRGESNSREIIAKIALDHWRKYREPIGGLLKSEILEFIENNKVDSKKRRVEYNKKELLELLEFILNGERLIPAQSMEDKVRRYLGKKKIRDAIDKNIDEQEQGTLTTKQFAEICRDVSDWTGKRKLEATDLISKETSENRVARRAKPANLSRPFILIDGIDQKTKCVGRGDLGLLLAPLKVGKSLGLAHIAMAYARQRLNVLYFSLEDPIDEVEDRFDAALTGLDINQLANLPNRFRKRFKKFSKVLKSRIKLIDGTTEEVGIADMEEVFLRYRDQGWVADAIVADYDDYIKPVRRYEKKTDRFDEIYIDYRRFLARYGLYGWTAAQSQRVKEGTQIITANMAADDIGKIRKVTMAIGMGYGKSHPDARYMYVAAHKRGRMHFGCEIMTRLSQGILYDRERTLSMQNKSKKTSDI